MSWAGDDIVRPVEFTLARETDTFDQAFRLVHDQYVARDYMSPEPSGRRINLRHALPSSRVFVAKTWSRVIGTVTLFRDSALGLPMDDLYKEQLDAWRARGRQIVEASHLATDPDNRAHGVAILMRMIRMLIIYAAEFSRLDDLCLVVNPRHVEFYEKFFDCRVCGEARSYGNVNGAPAVPLRLELDGVRDLIAGARFGRPPANDIRAFLYEPTATSAVMAELRQNIPRATMTSEQFAHFFAGSPVLRSAPSGQRDFVVSLHSELPTIGKTPTPRSLATSW